MALEARAEERETRGLTSITAYSKLSGFRASWQLQPPSTPMAWTMLMAAERSIWYSLSARVTAGATTMLSPVWTPTGSTFSMEQTVMQLPFRSRMTSNSISFQPEMHFSISTWVMGERRRPLRAISRSCSSSPAMPPPVPPSVKAGRTITG